MVAAIVYKYNSKRKQILRSNTLYFMNTASITMIAFMICFLNPGHIFDVNT